MKKVILVVLAVFLVQGCSTVTWSADRVAAGINTYCDRLTQQEREVMRARINLKAHPHAGRVYCYGDTRGMD